MALTEYIEIPPIRNALASVCPRPWRIPYTISAIPIYREISSAGVVGRAFNHCLGWELARLYPERAVTKEWRVEKVFIPPELLVNPAFLPDEVDLDIIDTAPELPDDMHRAVKGARIFVDTYSKLKSPTGRQKRTLIEHALKIARIEPFFRTYGEQVDETFDHVRPDEAIDVSQMLRIVKWSEIAPHPKKILVGPDFGRGSQLLGGADADLIVGDTLIDVTSSKKEPNDAFFRKRLRQLIGYYVVSLFARALGEDLPVVTKLAFYHARHAYLHVIDLQEITSDPRWPTVPAAFASHCDILDKITEDATKAAPKNRRNNIDKQALTSLINSSRAIADLSPA